MPKQSKPKRWGGRVTIQASLTLDFDRLDEIEASDEEGAKEQMVDIVKDAFRTNGDYDIDFVKVEDIYEVGNEAGEE